jgi:hypothetical protein
MKFFYIWAHFLLRKKPGFAGVPPLARPGPPAVTPPLQSLAHFAAPLQGERVLIVRRLRRFPQITRGAFSYRAATPQARAVR